MKKKIAIVSIGYVWFPCELGPSRFYYIAKMFADAGFEVDIITSNFQHFKKDYRDIDTIKEQNYPFHIEFVKVPKYHKNLDIRRIYSNKIAKRRIRKYFLENGKKYDAVYCTVPANDIAACVSKYCKKNKIPFVVDIEDLWPEAMKMVFRVPVVSDIIFHPFLRDAEIVYKNANGVIGTSEEYTHRAFKKRCDDIPHKTVYVGCDMLKFDEGVHEFAPTIEKEPGGFWVAYAGSIGASYDIRTLVLAAKEMERRGYNKIQFIIMGTGPFLEEIKQLALELGCNHVSILGYVQYPRMAAYLSKSDVTINSFVKGAPQSIVNKVGDYLAAGAAMINTLENDEFVRMIEHGKWGINVSPEDVKALSDAIEWLYSHPQTCQEMGIAARAYGEKYFSVAKSYQAIIEMIEEQIDANN